MTDTTNDLDLDLDQERADIIETLQAHRRFLRYTVAGLDDQAAAKRTTVSELCLGGIVKHLTMTEEAWVRFVQEGPSAMAGFDEAAMAARDAGFRMLEGDTLDGLLDRYEEVAAATDDLVATIPSLDLSHPLPERPWFPKGARRSARRVFLHIIAETAQHAGHADILRETLDGQKTMG
jgi:hypothetical protein